MLWGIFLRPIESHIAGRRRLRRAFSPDGLQESHWGVSDRLDTIGNGIGYSMRVEAPRVESLGSTDRMAEASLNLRDDDGTMTCVPRRLAVLFLSMNAINQRICRIGRKVSLPGCILWLICMSNSEVKAGTSTQHDGGQGDSA